MGLNLRPRDSIPDGQRQLHWLPIDSRIQFKLCLLMHRIHTGRCPSYISDTVQLVADHASRTGLRSGSTSLYILPRLRNIFGERAFSFSGPKAWNSLPDRFHLIESTVSSKKTAQNISIQSLCLVNDLYIYNCVLSCLSKRRWTCFFAIDAI